MQNLPSPLVSHAFHFTQSIYIVHAVLDNQIQLSSYDMMRPYILLFEVATEYFSALILRWDAAG